jgi:hypothetical protein
MPEMLVLKWLKHMSANFRDIPANFRDIPANFRDICVLFFCFYKKYVANLFSTVVKVKLRHITQFFGIAFFILSAKIAFFILCNEEGGQSV